MTTPKEAYELRKKARITDTGSRSEANELIMVDMLDRFVTAVERIADAAERTTA